MGHRMTHDPDRLIGEVTLAVLVSVFVWRFIRAGKISPEPWSEEIEKALHEPEAVEICHRCFDPVVPGSWFCKHCGGAVGPYNNLMPYVCVFSQGEVLRNGGNDKLPRNALIIIGYLLYSMTAYFIFAPIYWFFLFRNLKRQKESIAQIQ